MRTERKHGGVLRTLRVYVPRYSLHRGDQRRRGLDGGSQYRMSAGEPLSSYSRVDLAVSEISVLPMLWTAAAASSWSTGGG